MMTTIALFLQNNIGSGPSFLPYLSALGWVIAGLAALGYLIFGYIRHVSSSRKELIEVKEQQLKDLEKDLAKAHITIEQLTDNLASVKKESAEVLNDKVILMREHHQLLELSSNDLTRLQKALKRLKAMEDELNSYREERGLPKYDEAHVDL